MESSKSHNILEKANFKIDYKFLGFQLHGLQNGIMGWSIIALGSDVDGIQGFSVPGVAYHKPMVEGAPGHGEGHNSVSSCYNSCTSCSKNHEGK